MIKHTFSASLLSSFLLQSVCLTRLGDLVPAVAVNFEMGLTVQWLDRQIAREKMKEMRMVFIISYDITSRYLYGA